MQTVELYTRYCPGEEQIKISDAVCFGRRRVNYPKCRGCQFNDDERARSENRRLLAPGLVVDGPGSGRPDATPGAQDPAGQCASLDSASAWRFGFGSGTFLRGSLRGMDRSDLQRHRVIVGRDSSSRSADLARAAIEGLRASGTSVIDIGAVDAAQLHFALNHMACCGGLLFAGGSGGPDGPRPCVCGRGGMPVGPETGLQEIAAIAAHTAPRPVQRDVAMESADLTASYREFVLGFLEQCRPLKVVVDAAGGAAGRWFPALFEDIGDIEVERLNFEADEERAAAAEPGAAPTWSAARRRVEAVAADFGVCFDGAADRCTFIDETGRLIPGDLLGAFLAESFLRRQPGARVVHDVRCSRIVPQVVKRLGGVARCERTGLGAMIKAMAEVQAALGIERCGRFYFKDHWFGSSALLAIVHVVNILSNTDRTLGELLAPFRKYHASGEIAFRCADPDAALRTLREGYPQARVELLDGVSVQLPEWWCNVRKAGSPPLLLLNIEANTGPLLGQKMAEVAPMLGEPVEERI